MQDLLNTLQPAVFILRIFAIWTFELRESDNYKQISNILKNLCWSLPGLILLIYFVIQECISHDQLQYTNATPILRLIDKFQIYASAIVYFVTVIHNLLYRRQFRKLITKFISYQSNYLRHLDNWERSNLKLTLTFILMIVLIIYDYCTNSHSIPTMQPAFYIGYITPDCIMFIHIHVMSVLLKYTRTAFKEINKIIAMHINNNVTEKKKSTLKIRKMLPEIAKMHFKMITLSKMQNSLFGVITIAYIIKIFVASIAMNDYFFDNFYAFLLHKPYDLNIGINNLIWFIILFSYAYRIMNMWINTEKEVSKYIFLYIIHIEVVYFKRTTFLFEQIESRFCYFFH